jgi:putative thioredoxin
MTTPTPPPAGFSAYGAVDLGALAAQRAARERAEASRQAADGSGPPADGAVVEVTEASFQADVVDRSFTVPIVIDFWADWCGPCKQLSPILERLAAEAAGAWVLATIDTEANPRLAQAFQIQSIPAVYVVWQGQLVPGFTGALPEADVRQFLEQVAALPGTSGGSAGPEAATAGPGASTLDPMEAAALDALDAGDLDAAARAFADLVAAQPGNAEAALGLARVQLMLRTRDVDPAVARAAADASPDDVDAQCLAADVDVATGRVQDAITRLVDTVRRTAEADREQARRHVVELFAVLDDDDPHLAKGRSALASALF